MQATNTVQMNVRIDKDLKLDGDRVFEAIGLNPTKAIRALYELAASCKADPSKVARLLGSSSGKDEPDARTAKIQLTHEEWERIDSAIANLGLGDNLNAFSDDPNIRAKQYKEMIGKARWEKYGKGF